MALMKLPTAPDAPAATTTATVPATKSSSATSTKGGGGVDPYTAALKAQKKAEAKAKHSASKRALRDAETLGKQAAALQAALSSEGFVKALHTGLANIATAQAQSDAVLMEGYGNRVKSLANADSDNTKAAAGQTYANLTNRGREQANALSEAMAQGAGESDVLRSQQMALRNWNANQSEVARSFYDTRTSVNASLHDLNADTKTARVNNALQAEADRGQVYSTYYGQVGETQTQLGNVFGQQAADYSAALEQVGSKKTRRRLKRAQHQSQAAYLGASQQAGKAYSSPGAGPELTSWQGRGDFTGGLSAAPVEAITESATTDLGKPEGATLRKWTP